MDCIHDMVHQSHLRTSVPLFTPGCSPVNVRIGVVVPSVDKPLVGEDTGKQVPIWMAFVSDLGLAPLTR